MTGQRKIRPLIINSPYEEPAHHWRYDRARRRFQKREGRRAAGYTVASENAKAFDDPGIFVEIPLVNEIRARVKTWREAGYPGVTGITRRLLTHWNDREEFARRRFFFCQLEAVETLIWLVEQPNAQPKNAGLHIPGDGGAFERLCCKMATGSGKTIVMAMCIAWQVLNRCDAPHDARFAKDVLVIAPGLTVKNRLAVLLPSHPNNYYEEFNICPPAMLEQLRRGKVLVHNWHKLDWESDERIAKKRSVDKRGAKSDCAYAQDVLGEMAAARNLLVINDEAHHAWRAQPGAKHSRGVNREDVEQATKWIGGLDRIHRARGVLRCFDFSATPFVPGGKRASEEALFGWIVSDFGLNDATEAGLVKTPTMVVREDAPPKAKTFHSRLYHIYNDREVKDDLSRKAAPESELPDLVTNGYVLLGYDWQKTAQHWRKQRHRFPGTPPVMITVANRTETAARIKYAFDHGNIPVQALQNPERTLHIDSKVLGKAEAADETGAKQIDAEQLRQMVDSVGKPGKAGANIQNVISVGMLSEGWDAKTVTHIMGLRAFSSQLLCEQVIGRGLRRTSYETNRETGLFEAEYVNVFGVPFAFLPHEAADETGNPPLPQPKTAIEAVAEKAEFALKWPNVIRVDGVFRPRLSVDWKSVETLELDAAQTIQMADLAQMVEGKPDLQNITTIKIDEHLQKFRMQKIIFETARKAYHELKPNWQGDPTTLIAQLVRLTEEFVESNGIQIHPPLFNQDSARRRLVITFNMAKVARHILQAVHCENAEQITAVLDSEHPIRRTGDMQTWYTAKPCAPAKRSHINFCVYDSTWESSDAYELDRNPAVQAWAKNDHLGFEVPYTHKGAVRKYRPDFLARLQNGEMLVLETKGREGETSRAKFRALQEWVAAVNAHGGFGRWRAAMARRPGEIKTLLKR